MLRYISNRIQKLFGRGDLYIGGMLYMRRWQFIDNRWFGARVHHIVASDIDRDLHDHPFAFLSIILSGGYWEETPAKTSFQLDGEGFEPIPGPYPNGTHRRWYGPGSVLFRRARDLHRLDLRRRLDGREQSTWTFVIRGPVERSWGFRTPAGWVHWKKYVTRRNMVRYARPS